MIRPLEPGQIRSAWPALALLLTLVACRVDYDLLGRAPGGSQSGAPSHVAGAAGSDQTGTGASSGSENGAGAAAARAGTAGNIDGVGGLGGGGTTGDSGGSTVAGSTSDDAGARGGNATGGSTTGGSGDAGGAQAGTASADGGATGGNTAGGQGTGGGSAGAETGGSATGGSGIGGRAEAGSAVAAGGGAGGASGQGGTETGGSGSGGAETGGTGGVGLGDGTLVSFGERDAATFKGVTEFTTLTESEPDNPFAEMVQVYVSGTAGNFACNQVGLLRFDVSALASSVTVTGAELHLTTRSIGAMTSGSITIHRVLESWVYMEATWNNRWTAPAAQAWTALGCGVGSRDSTVLATFSPTEMSTEYVIPLPASVVQGWVSDLSSNHGLALVASDGGDDALFHNGLTGNSQAMRPLLSVTYQ